MNNIAKFKIPLLHTHKKKNTHVSQSTSFKQPFLTMYKNVADFDHVMIQIFAPAMSL